MKLVTFKEVESMANIVPIQPKDTLKGTRQKIINRQFTEIDQDIKQHKQSTQAHKSDDITYNGDVTGTNNVKQALDSVKGEINTIVAHAGDGTKDTELIIARGNEPTLGDRLNASDQRLNDKIIVTENPPAVADRLEGSFYFHITDSIPTPSIPEPVYVGLGFKVKE